ncbi:holin family protein [Aestuariispira ectoiniformans]|uniref:holin family protein n=1 Tax=Aestuariispira ectoiniformans TaxID=2775080 RepID=UPI00223C233C|nr:holin family protein [Aestuariispira ectoiniformans]
MAPLIGLLAPLLGTVLDRVLPDTVERDKVEAELAATLLQHSARIEETAAEVVVAEAKGESWLQRNWRPMLMVLFGYIVAHNYVIAPIFDVPKAEMPDHLWELLKIGVGGYIVSRGAEKGINLWKKN